MEAFGIDLGSGSAFQVSSSGDIIRNELGGHSSGSLVAFSGLERVIGEVFQTKLLLSPSGVFFISLCASFWRFCASFWSL